MSLFSPEITPPSAIKDLCAPLPAEGAVGLLMFRGELPIYAREAITQNSDGRPPVTFGFSEAPPDAPPDYQLSLGQAGKLLALLRKHQVRRLCFFGALHRPKFLQLRFDWEGLKFFWSLKSFLLQGDDALMRAILTYFEQKGFIIPQPAEILPSLLCPVGAMTKIQPTAEDFISAGAGIRYLHLTAPTDTGQACAAAGKLISAVEASEGTAEMIERAGRLAKTRLKALPAPVLVKLSKPGQDTRADLPAIGIKTIEQLQNAGFRGAFLSAGRCFLSPPAETIRAADGAGLFLYGLTETELSEQ